LEHTCEREARPIVVSMVSQWGPDLFCPVNIRGSLVELAGCLDATLIGSCWL